MSNALEFIDGELWRGITESKISSIGTIEKHRSNKAKESNDIYGRAVQNMSDRHWPLNWSWYKWNIVNEILSVALLVLHSKIWMFNNERNSSCYQLEEKIVYKYCIVGRACRSGIDTVEWYHVSNLIDYTQNEKM